MSLGQWHDWTNARGVNLKVKAIGSKIQKNMMTSSNRNIFRVTCFLWYHFTRMGGYQESSSSNGRLISTPITCFKVWYRVSYCDSEPSWLLTGHQCPRGWEHAPIQQLVTHRYLLVHTAYILQRSKSADTWMKCKYLGKYILNFPLDPVSWLLE